MPKRQRVFGEGAPGLIRANPVNQTVRLLPIAHKTHIKCGHRSPSFLCFSLQPANNGPTLASWHGSRGPYSWKKLEEPRGGLELDTIPLAGAAPFETLLHPWQPRWETPSDLSWDVAKNENNGPHRWATHFSLQGQRKPSLQFDTWLCFCDRISY